MLNLPERASVVDVAPRDGLQSFPRWLDTDLKVAVIDRLSEVGFPTIEVTGFVHPRVIPNLRDAEDVMARIRRRPGTVYRALVPNAKGAERAAAAGADEILGLIVVSESYLKKNQNMTTEQAVAQSIRAFEIAEGAGMRYVQAVSAAFFDAYEGVTPEAKVLDLVGRFQAAGIRRMYLAGSMGMEDPAHVNRLFRRVLERWPELELGFHAHNLSGAGTANVMAALDAGASWVEGSICGIGGGTAFPGGVGSVGNLPSEDIVYLLNECGIATGIDTDAVIAAARDIARMLGIQPASHIANAGSRAELLSKGRARPGPAHPD